MHHTVRFLGDFDLMNGDGRLSRPVYLATLRSHNRLKFSVPSIARVSTSSSIFEHSQISMCNSAAIVLALVCHTVHFLPFGHAPKKRERERDLFNDKVQVLVAQHKIQCDAMRCGVM